MAQATPQSTSESPGSWNATTLTELLDVYTPAGTPVRNINDGATLVWNSNIAGTGKAGWVVTGGAL